MNEILNMIVSSLVPVLVTVITGIISYIGMSLRNLITTKMTKDRIDKIVTQTVNYVEQISKNNNLSSAEKFIEAKDKAQAWLEEENLKVSNVELEILIECAVRHLQH